MNILLCNKEWHRRLLGHLPTLLKLKCGWFLEDENNPKNASNFIKTVDEEQNQCFGMIILKSRSKPPWVIIPTGERLIINYKKPWLKLFQLKVVHPSTEFNRALIFSFHTCVLHGETSTTRWHYWFNQCPVIYQRVPHGTVLKLSSRNKQSYRKSNIDKSIFLSFISQ